MRAKAKFWIIAVLAGVTLLLALGWWLLAGVGAYTRLTKALPAPVRLYYLNRVFDQPEPGCNPCYSRIVGALDALSAARSNGEDYGFDYVRLFPLVRMGDVFDEPIPGAACYMVLMYRDPRIYQALAREFGQDPKPLQDCMRAHLRMMRERAPDKYELTRAALMKVPLFADWILQAQW